MSNNENKEMVVSRLKILMINSDGSKHEQTTIMPHEIASKIICAALTWKEDWVTTTKTVEKFQKSEQEFIEKQKEII
jgi:hypothetical protein